MPLSTRPVSLPIIVRFLRPFLISPSTRSLRRADRHEPPDYDHGPVVNPLKYSFNPGHLCHPYHLQWPNILLYLNYQSVNVVYIYNDNIDICQLFTNTT